MSFDLKIVAGDVSFTNGDLSVITGKDKLKQDLLKLALTEVGSNPLQSWYGSFVSASIIGSSLPIDVISSMAKSQLEKSIDTLKQLQAQQAASGQAVSPDEQISFIKGISVLQNQADLRILNVSIEVLTRAFGQVGASFTV